MKVARNPPRRRVGAAPPGLGPAASAFLVDSLGYRGLFAALAGLGAAATVIVVALVPETLSRHAEFADDGIVVPMATTSDLSTTL